MGTWGSGLYSGDFAADLRGLIRSIARIPLPVSDYVALATDWAGGAATDPLDEQHSVFWLVLADQFHRRGIEAPEVTAKALDLIRSGHDLAMMRELDMGAAALRKRAAMLEALAATLASPPAAVQRKLLKGPQKLLMATGDLLAFPVMHRKGWNPYYAPSDKPRLNWQPEGWMVVLVLMTGRFFDHLAWYGTMMGTEVFPELPDLDAALASPADEAPFSGTCSTVHFARLELRRIGGVEVAPLPPEQAARIEARGNGSAINDVSIANGLWARPAGPDRPALRDFTVTAG